MREIPTLQALCLRSIGPHSCSAEAVFCPAKSGGGSGGDDNETTSSTATLSTASRLLRSFLVRPTTERKLLSRLISASNDDLVDDDTMRYIPMPRTACIGPGSARRVQANEVDLHHPVIACLEGDGDDNDDDVGRGRDGGETEDKMDDDRKVVAAAATLGSSRRPQQLIMWHGNSALDTLQAYIDALVEMGRMDDVRLGRYFWEEWKMAIILHAKQQQQPSVSDAAKDSASETPTPTPSKKRQKRQSASAAVNAVTATTVPPPAGLGALSLHNCVVGEETFERMREADLGPYLAVLDLTGVRGLTDDLLAQVLPTVPNLKQLSLKNCRRITVKTVQVLVEHVTKLESLDVGGAYNLNCQQLVDTVLPNKLPKLTALHASGLGWDDDALGSLVHGRSHWVQLSLSFSMNVTQSALKTCLSQVADSLTSLALAFCESFMDNAALGLLGRNLPHVVSLDVRGNPQLNTMTGWYDGRVSADLPAQRLTVLGRYSGLSDSSVEETKRSHPMEARELVVILDGGGMGAGITRTDGSGGASGATAKGGD